MRLHIALKLNDEMKEALMDAQDAVSVEEMRAADKTAREIYLLKDSHPYGSLLSATKRFILAVVVFSNSRSRTTR